MPQRPAHGERQQEAVEAEADHVAQCRRSDQRQEHVWARPDAVIAEGIGKTIAPIRQVERLLPGHVDQPADAHGGVDGKAPDSLRSFSRLELEQEVQRHDRFGQVAQKVPQTHPDRARHAFFIDIGDRRDHGIVDRLDGVIARLIDRLHRVLRRRLFARNDNSLVILLDLIERRRWRLRQGNRCA